VPFEPATWLMPKREVEQRNFLTQRRTGAKVFSKSETVWFATLTTRIKRVGTMPYFLQAKKNWTSSFSISTRQKSVYGFTKRKKVVPALTG
jgi:hypothetical protein